MLKIKARCLTSHIYIIFNFLNAPGFDTRFKMFTLHRYNEQQKSHIFLAA